jgi:hypothetical protein
MTYSFRVETSSQTSVVDGSQCVLRGPIAGVRERDKKGDKWRHGVTEREHARIIRGFHP